ncbi:MAG: M14 family metallopeptidase [Planctomycetota bacterium]
MIIKNLFAAGRSVVFPLMLLAQSASAEQRSRRMLGEGKSWETPVFTIDPEVRGPTVIITGGVHGNEPAGAAAAEQIRHWPIRRGKLIVIPRVNTAGLEEGTRYIPKAIEEQKDLNRNFPSPGIAEGPRGEIASTLWELVADQNPDWLFDLHEGYQFNISHKPKSGKQKSVGSSIIFDSQQDVDSVVAGMLAAANSRVTRADRRFVLLGRGPKKTTLAAAAVDVIGARAMTLETTYQYQRLPVRTRQHRAMINVALNHLGMIETDCTDVMAPVESERRDRTFVALYDDEGGSDRGVTNLARALSMNSDIEVVRLSADDIRSNVLSQFDVVVFGGGSGSKEAAAIGDEGAVAVRAFVQDGGGCVGVCAGAFLCSAHYQWSLNLVDTHVFTGKREVEGVGAKSMWYRGKSSSQKMQLTKEGRSLFPDTPEHVEVRYQNGPIVSPKSFPGLNPYTVLAWFRSEKVLYAPQKGTMIDTPAIISGDYGKGRVISISPHPEATEGLESMIPQSIKAVSKVRRKHVAEVSVSPRSDGPKVERSVETTLSVAP